jgi:hypothetical protein
MKLSGRGHSLGPRSNGVVDGITSSYELTQYQYIADETKQRRVYYSRCGWLSVGKKCIRDGSSDINGEVQYCWT